MVDPILAEAYELNRAGEPFALVSVTRSQRPTSGKPGNRAIVRADGSLAGWIGGGCAQSVVVKEGLRCLQDGQPRLVRIRGEGREPGEAVEEGDVVEYTMTCPSGGTVELYIQPFLPQPHLLILGASPVARALAQLAPHLDFAVTLVDPGERSAGDAAPSIPPRSYVVIATMGDGDEEALAQALSSEAVYVAFVASRKKMAVLGEHLRAQGFSREQLARIRAPAGLDIGAVTPAEIALSILAEITQLRRTEGLDVGVAYVGEAAATLAAVEAREARDPICGMMVDTATARYVATYDGRQYYFCCEHCKTTFEQEPAKYVGEESR